MHIQRWRQGWLLLSLDAVEPFHADLWLRPLDSGFREGLCRALEPWVRTQEYVTDFGRAHSRLASWVSDRYGAEGYQHLTQWMDYVLLLEGPDRVPETVWSVFVYKLATNHQTAASLSPEARQCLSDARVEHEARKRDLERRIVARFGQPPSSWDEPILELQNAEPDDIANVLRLTGDCDLFVEAWEHHCRGLTVMELDQLNAIGQQLAQESHMEGIQGGSAARYPAIWRSELLPLMKGVNLQTP